jgi:hypothetical protein
MNRKSFFKALVGICGALTAKAVIPAQETLMCHGNIITFKFSKHEKSIKKEFEYSWNGKSRQVVFLSREGMPYTWSQVAAGGLLDMHDHFPTPTLEEVSYNVAVLQNAIRDLD